MKASSSVAAPSSRATSAGAPSASSSSAVQHEHAIGGFGFLDQVRRPQHAGVAFAYIGAHRGEQIAPGLRVEPDGGLVHQHQHRPVQQRAHQLDLAAIAAGELAHRTLEVVAEAHGSTGALHALVRDAAPQPVQVGMKLQVLLHAQVEIERQLLEHHADEAQRGHRIALQRMTADADFAGVGDEQPGQHLEQRRLARTVRAEEGDELPLRQLEAHLGERDPLAVALGEAGDREHACLPFGPAGPTSAKARSNAQSYLLGFHRRDLRHTFATRTARPGRRRTSCKGSVGGRPGRWSSATPMSPRRACRLPPAGWIPSAATLGLRQKQKGLARSELTH